MNDIPRDPQGYCLAELMLVLSLLGIFLTLGMLQFSGGLSRQQARCAAQSSQAALAWAQTSALWRGGTYQVLLEGEDLTVTGLADDGDAASEVSTPACEVSSNVVRWNTSQGIRLRFLDPFGAPDSGGSLYFGSHTPDYRVTVRPESGLSVRSVMPR